MTWGDLIKSSLRLIGQLGPGRTGGASELTDALFVLNSMLDYFNSKRTFIYVVAPASYTLTANLNPHTIGASGTFNVTRPEAIETAKLILTNVTPNVELPLEIVGKDRYAQWAIPAITSPIPRELYYDRSYPQGKIYLYPVPDTAYGLKLYTWSLASQITDTTTTVSFPAGYADAIRYNLAVRLAPEWGKAPRPEVHDLARKCLAEIQSRNSVSPDMATDEGFRGAGYYDYRTGLVE